MSVQPTSEALTCPECGWTFEEKSYGWKLEPPRVGGLVVCFNCGALACCGPDGVFHGPTLRDTFHFAFINIYALERMERHQAEIRRRGPIWPEKGVAR